MSDQKQKDSIIQLIWQNKAYFLTNLFIVLTITFSILYLFGLVPDEFKTIIGREPVKENKGNIVGELPVNIKISVVGIDSPVYNPATTSISVLDEWLKKGAVKYPGSGLLGVKGNMLLLGHSTSFKIVNNPAYKTFVGLEDLKEGDLIYIFSDKYEYQYKVFSVITEKASNVRVDFQTNGKSIVTLVTCNTSVASKEARHIVQAEFVNRKALVNNQ